MNNKHNLFAVILAGGSGTRFWPLSRKNKPKQFLNITGKDTLIQKTIKRIRPSIKSSNIFIVTNEIFKKEIQQLISKYGIPAKNILFEPEGKNTAPAICWVAMKIHKLCKEANIAVLPSDHLILNQKKFLKILDKAFSLAAKDYLVTLGIVPARPETGYGYLKGLKRKVGGKDIIFVDHFTEKPNLKKAKMFIKDRNYFWNSGMFIWKAGVILEEFNKYLPKLYSLLSENPIDNKNIKKIWKNIIPISVDYGILEKSKKVVAVPAQGIEWSDLGSWESITDVLSKDKKGNIIKGDVIALNCKDNLIWSKGRLISTIGLNNIIVIDTPDSLLICKMDMSQKVKDIVDILKKKKRTEHIDFLRGSK